MKKKLLISITILILISGCNNITQPKDNSKGPYMELLIEGGLDQNITYNAVNCNQGLVCDYFPTLENFPGKKNLHISASTDAIHGSNTFGFNLYFNELPADGVFPLSQDNITSDGIWGIGTFSPDGLDFGNGYGTTESPYVGFFAITEYNQALQTISGNFNFKGQKMVNSEYVDESATFTGNFYNIPITDRTDPAHPKGPCYGTTGSPIGTGSTPTGSTSLTFHNTTFTKLNVTFNGETKSANPGANAVFSGAPNTQATGKATTSGLTTSGTQVGLLLNWNLQYNFPASGNTTIDINVSKDYFFLKINNYSSYTMNKVYVNYGLTSQTLDNITLAPNSTTPYDIGYYYAYSNSNVRLENSSLYWTFSPLSLPFTVNQSKTINATN